MESTKASLFRVNRNSSSIAAFSRVLLQSILEYPCTLLKVGLRGGATLQFLQTGPSLAAFRLVREFAKCDVIRALRQMAFADSEDRPEVTFGHVLAGASDVGKHADRPGGDRLHLFIVRILRGHAYRHREQFRSLRRGFLARQELYLFEFLKSALPLCAAFPLGKRRLADFVERSRIRPIPQSFIQQRQGAVEIPCVGAGTGFLPPLGDCGNALGCSCNLCQLDLPLPGFFCL